MQIINPYDVHLEFFPAFLSFHYISNRLLTQKESKFSYKI